MATRYKLRSQLKQAWKNTIFDRYNQQLINSEHGLQAYFCAELLNQLKDSKRRIFIEPLLSFSDKRRHPDIVICNSQSIIAIIELKYLPRGRPSYKKDLETLEIAVKNKKELTISNDRFRGKRSDDKKYTLAPDAVLCWAAVYTGKTLEIKAPKLGAHFLQLDALTMIGEDAEVEK